MAVQKLSLPQPATRRLRVYAFDPNASLDLGAANFNQAMIALTWRDDSEEPLQPGPINDYLEIIDIDPSSKKFYEPLDLNDPLLLAQDGLTPSEGDPRFHQQMCFAVIMKTIRQFERALGRKVIWAPRWDNVAKTYQPTFKLRVYPHALREANAYYSRSQRALLFGYFKASQRSSGANWVFTALSHDIIVHETTHAILDGLHHRFSEPTSPDSLAFHEAFADIAALFSHFQIEEAVSHYITRDRGSLDRSGLLSGLAAQFAQGTTGHRALRDYIDTDPNPDDLAAATEPHDRGAILVAAVYDAFLMIYRSRTQDLLRIGGVTADVGVQLHPDLVARLTKEATRAADHVLRMCIRALDYLPPVDVRFGDFLRAIITADADLVPDDRLNYRLAFVEAFRRRGIFADNCLSMSPDNLIWPSPPRHPDDEDMLKVDDVQYQGLDLVARFKRQEIFANAEANRRKVWYYLSQPEICMKPPEGVEPTAWSAELRRADNERLNQLMARLRRIFAEDDFSATPDRARAFGDFVAQYRADFEWLELPGERIAALPDLLAQFDADAHYSRWCCMFDAICGGARIALDEATDREWERALGVYFKRRDAHPPFTVRGSHGDVAVEVASVRATRRAGPDGQDIRQLVIEVTQRRHGFHDPIEQAKQDLTRPDGKVEQKRGDFVFRGGATLIIDLRENRLRYVIAKRIDDDERLRVQRESLTSPDVLGFTYDPHPSGEPFALLHRH